MRMMDWAMQAAIAGWTQVCFVTGQRAVSPATLDQTLIGNETVELFYELIDAAEKAGAESAAEAVGLVVERIPIMVIGHPGARMNRPF